MSWTNDYIGIPFLERGRDRNGADCWGLVRLVLLERFSIEVHSLAEYYATTSDRERIAAIYNDNDELANWRRVDSRRVKPGDIIVLRIIGRPIHFGVVVSDSLFLHTLENLNAHLSDHRSSLWASRVVDVLRHKSKA